MSLTCGPENKGKNALLTFSMDFERILTSQFHEREGRVTATVRTVAKTRNSVEMLLSSPTSFDLTRMNKGTQINVKGTATCDHRGTLVNLQSITPILK